jgi:hypothetical protein
MNVNATAGTGSSIYYKFYSCANYGTASYDSTPWIAVRDYSTENKATYIFSQPGHYVLGARMVTDPSKEPAALPLVGATVSVGGEAAIYWKRFSYDKTGTIHTGENMTVTAEAGFPDGRPVYYKFITCANYGTAEYNNTPWQVVQEYSTRNQVTVRFSEAGNYVVSARASTDPLNEPAVVPIIGGTITVE